MRKTELLKGTTEMILLSLLGERDMYGYEIIEQLKLRSEGYFTFKEGMLYPALKKLEQKEYLKSYWRDSMEGPRRKYYYATKKGSKQAEELWEEWEVFQETIRRISNRPAE
ncbi:PadR family transcriptional regulator [Bacillus massiliglaciei]|uniref:PadR family transcriptional regulator n=1 Tax=Bacillus massiliglaciei TaxID=1816693 RepID=UPI000DA5F24D|nr:PadR family transcriptional regulator [Bacillus massiliglaciei]